MAAAFPALSVGYPTAAPGPSYGALGGQSCAAPSMPVAGAYAPQGYQAPPELHSWFAAVDRDHSGRIDMNELNQALSNAGFRFSLGTTEMLMRRYDLDRSGTITMEEFAHLHEFVSSMREGFRQRDTSGDGRLDGAETREAFRLSGFALSEATFQAVMRKFDRQRRGNLGFDDYIELSVFMAQTRDAFAYFDFDHDGTATFNFDTFLGAQATLR
ncbi:EF hand-like protein [Leptomonas pyrrhocoris]|uniref:EF hand-like protein n=1 Tax=Leptomonas pyrrhocoris TaxID=157538 RepID=A0A0M9FUW5_LEPPY|nr:EF hand-like protein [Leptomonas pyrrhocoris]XP_015654805.1 EF hand-like protein [Leptomonas pyrrhocoris]KPA76365.1 EF hand-like protein [Leptomonas pyrrhocoris]KPA76366.1 EF hand-like protein [Leptomonas pyrrhocoris]|eukprot:XP_015654804.1 EF hand-like protein [Leptomonas pyrrhocoris]